MAHPLRFDPADPLLAQLRSICLAMPGSQEKVSHGNPCFYTRKIFAVFGAVVKGDPGSVEYGRSVLVLPDAEEREALVADERFFVPAYYGPFGWLGLHLAAFPPDWAEVAELVDMSYRNTAPRTFVRRLDEQPGTG